MPPVSSSGPRPHPTHTHAIAVKAGLSDASALFDCLMGCGFQPDAYLAGHADLVNAGLDPMHAAAHFLEHGYRESRTPHVGPLPDGLAALAALPMTDRTYASMLFRSVFLHQARHPDAAGRLWAGADRNTIDAIRTMGGLPYFIVGDSHASHYVRDAAFGSEWLAGMAMVCFGATGAGLASLDPPSRFGPRILRWAQASAPLDVPVFLKFGGIDAEFRWMTHRIQDRIGSFSVTQFDEYAKDAVARYGRFLARLTERLPAACLRICAAFPTRLADRYWIDGYVAANGGPPEAQQRIRAALWDMEIPDFAMRIALRGRYNAHLRALCDTMGLVFVDDFTPFRDPASWTDRQIDDGKDFHMKHDAIGQKLDPIVHAYAQPHFAAKARRGISPGTAPAKPEQTPC
ncbi:MAG: hypothetical protein WCI94_12050 [Rhodospirillales bacterium]